MNDAKNMFDNIAENYEQIMQDNLGKGQDVKYYAEYKIKLTQKLLRYDPKKILEYGCGTGRNMPYIKKYFPTSEIFGSDISVKSLDLAKSKYTDATFMLVDKILESGQKFDLILVPNVFHHIDINERMQVMGNIKSLLVPNGVIVIIENNPYNPVTVRKVKTCPFDEGVILLKKKEAVEIAKKCNLDILDSGYCLFFPSNFKKLAFLEIIFKLLPLGAQYYVVAKN